MSSMEKSSIRDRYNPSVTIDGLCLKVKGLPGPNEDPSFSRRMFQEFGDDIQNHRRSWYLPIESKAVEKLDQVFGVKSPKLAHERAEWLVRVAEARRKANIWRDQPMHEKEEWLKKKGLRYREYPPLGHQVTGIGYGLQLPVWGGFFDTGLGKTYIAAQMFQILKDSKGQGPFLVVAPKSLLRVAWGKDIEKHTFLSWMDIGDPPVPPRMTVCPVCKRDFVDRAVPTGHLKTHLKAKIERYKKAALEKYEGYSPESVEKKTDELIDTEVWQPIYRKYPDLVPATNVPDSEKLSAALKRTDIDVYVINPEQAKMAKQQLIDRKFSAMVVDESSMMRAHDSQNTEALIEMGWTMPRRVAMSGTPRPNSSLELWGQFAMLDGCLGPRFHVFRDKYFEQDHMGYNWRPRRGSESKIADIIEERSLRFKLDDCVDLPGETTETREVELSTELKRHYKKMLDDMFVELDNDDGRVTTSQKLVQINKLAQITSGFIYDKDGNTHYLDKKNPKLDEAISLAHELVGNEGRNVVIWIRFSGVEADALKSALKQYGVSVLIGGMSSNAIEREAEAFISGKNKIMVAHPLSAKFGHTWTHATACIFLSYDYSFENYYQSKRRIYRIGQKNPVTYINIVAKGTVDKVIMKALTRKEGESAAVIDRKMLNEIRNTTEE